MVEIYARILLTKILTPFATGYVDLQSPAGAGISVAVYNYDGDVYATDEARMLAEMGDRTFRLGNLHSNTYEEVFGGPLLRSLVLRLVWSPSLVVRNVRSKPSAARIQWKTTRPRGMSSAIDRRVASVLAIWRSSGICCACTIAEIPTFGSCFGAGSKTCRYTPSPSGYRTSHALMVSREGTRHHTVCNRQDYTQPVREGERP